MEQCETQLFPWKEPLEWPSLTPIEIILYTSISISDSIAINLYPLLALKKLFYLLLCFIHNNNNLFCCLYHLKYSLLNVFLCCIMLNCLYNSNKQNSQHRHFKRINPRMIITWDNQGRTHISLSRFALQNCSADMIKLDWNLFQLKCIQSRSGCIEVQTCLKQLHLCK